MRDSQAARTPAPWWWPQIALFWLEVTAIYAGLTWLGRRFGLWVLTALACAAVFTVVSSLAHVFIRGMEETPNRSPGQARSIGFTIALLLATAGLGCSVGYLLA